MQRCSHSFSTATALRTIFFPTSSQTCVSTFLTPSYATDSARYSPLCYSPSSRASYVTISRQSSRAPSSRPRCAPSVSDLRKFGAQHERRPKDEEIEARYIRLVGGREEGKATWSIVAKAEVLDGLDRDKDFLVQVNAGTEEDPTPVCKIISRKDYFDQEQGKGKKPGGAAAKQQTKTLEFSWSIDKNDLNHRLNKANDFLADGKKVEIFMGPKKRGKTVSAADAQLLIDLIKERLLEGAVNKEFKPMEGKAGAHVTLFFERKI